jgi:hypothetical protein
MRSFTTFIAAATLILISASPAPASCETSSGPTSIGAVGGDSEKDTFGFLCGAPDVAQTGSTGLDMPRSSVAIGAALGDDEKDTLGYVQTAQAQ